MAIRNPLVLVNGRISELPTGDSLASAAPINTGAVQQLGKVVTSGSQQTITFSNIPQNFTNLRIVFRGRDTASVTNTNMQIKLNNDATAANYANIVFLAGSGSSATSGTAGADTHGMLVLASVGVSGNANAVMTGEILIAGYADTTFQKMVSGHASGYYGSSPTTVVNWYSGVWKSAAAVTQVDLWASSTAFADGTTAILFGEGPTNYSVSPFRSDFVNLAQIVTTGSQATVDFTSIPQNYTNLMVTYQCRDTQAGTASQQMRARVNADATAANYTSVCRVNTQNQSVIGSSVAASALGVMVGGTPQDGNTAGITGAGKVTFFSYARTLFNKTFISESAWDDASTNLSVGVFTTRWKSTAAINQVTFTTDGTAFKDGSVFTLYGMT